MLHYGRENIIDLYYNSCFRDPISLKIHNLQRRYLGLKIPGSFAFYYVLRRKFAMRKGRLLSPNLNRNNAILDRRSKLPELQ
jgi:hypothetical protein